MDPNSPSYGTKDGSCGYGTLPKDAYPYFATAAFSPSNRFYQQGPLNACGQCFRLTVSCTGKAALDQRQLWGGSSGAAAIFWALHLWP